MSKGPGATEQEQGRGWSPGHPSRKAGIAFGAGCGCPGFSFQGNTPGGRIGGPCARVAVPGGQGLHRSSPPGPPGPPLAGPAWAVCPTLTSPGQREGTERSQQALALGASVPVPTASLPRVRRAAIFPPQLGLGPRPALQSTARSAPCMLDGSLRDPEPWYLQPGGQRLPSRSLCGR